MRRALYWVSDRGFNRSVILRQLIKLRHARTRELRARAMTRRDPVSRLLHFAVTRLERGVLRIAQGHAGGIVLDMRHLPLSHAHFGSLAHGNLESSVQEAMLRHLPPGGVFYDIGANLGFFAMLGAHFAGVNDGLVYAFEAAPDNAEAIRANLRLNGLTNVVVIDRAVAAHAGRAQLQVVDDQSWSKLAEFGEHPNTETVIEVETVAIDDLVAHGELRPPDLVKIDVEGAELAVLEGMRETIDRFRPAIICELHATHAEFLAFMTGCGYRVVNLDGAVPIEQAGPSAHALALPALDPGD